MAFVIPFAQVRIIIQMTNQSRALNWLVSISASATEADWETLYVEELPRVYNFFRYRVGDAFAEDLTSITFEKAWRSRRQYRSSLAAFSTWLFTIARNVATDHFRKTRLEVSLEDICHHADTNTPEDLAIRCSEFVRLSTLLASLTNQERELLALKYGSGLTNRTIAQITGLSESNVGTLLHRTVVSLRKQW